MENLVQFKIPTMLTIDEAAKETNMAKHFIRSLAISNKIVHVRCGKKYLINLEKFIEYLNTSVGIDEEQNIQQEKCCIKPIKV